jgi:hypothetical protein
MNIYHCHLSVPGKKPPVTGVEQQPLFFNFFLVFWVEGVYKIQKILSKFGKKSNPILRRSTTLVFYPI